MDDRDITNAIKAYASLLRKKGYVGPNTARSISSPMMVQETIEKLNKIHERELAS